MTHETNRRSWNKEKLLAAAFQIAYYENVS